MNSKFIKSLLLLAVIVAGVVTAWIIRDKPVGKYDQAANLMLDKLFHFGDRTRESDKLEIYFENSRKTGKGLYAIDKVEIKSPRFASNLKVETFEVTRLDQKNEFPHFFTLKLKGLKITRDTLPGGMLYLPFLQIRMKEVLADARLSLDYDLSKKTLLFSAKISLRQLLDLDFSIRLNRFDSALLAMIYSAAKRDMDLLEMHLDASSLADLKLKVSNTGFIQRIFKSMSPGMKSALKETLKRQLSTATHPTARQWFQALTDLLQYKKALSIVMHPEQTLNFRQLALLPGAEQITKLNISIEAEK